MLLRVLTLNVWALTPPLSRDTAVRMRAIGEALAALELDVVAFQELWDVSSREALLAASASSGLEHVWHPPEGLAGSGLAVLSRWPIRRATLTRFEQRGVAELLAEADYWGHKGYAELLLETPRGPVAFFDTHLQAAYAPRDSDPHVPARIAQTMQLAARLREVSDPVILAGDLNFEEAHEEYELLLGVARVRDSATALDRRQDTIVSTNPYSRGDQRGERIDYLFSRSGAKQTLVPLRVTRALDQELVRDGKQIAYSDHAGLLGEFELRGGGEVLQPVDPAALHMARPLLEAGRSEVERRRQRQRVVGSLGLASVPFAAMLARREALSRRRFLRAALLGAGAMGGLFGASRLLLAETWRPEETRGFDAALARLRALGG